MEEAEAGLFDWARCLRPMGASPVALSLLTLLQWFAWVVHLELALVAIVELESYARYFTIFWARLRILVAFFIEAFVEAAEH